MLCANPYMLGVNPCGCGLCLPCRINRRRLWAFRIVLESYMHEDNSFVTLTYKDEELSDVGEWNGDKKLVPNLVLKDVQDWFKRYRKSMGSRRIRYFVAGEYGDDSWRPHYHVALFGSPACLRGRTDHRLKTCCTVCERVRSTWGKGGVDVGQLTPESASYVAGYVTKKLTQPDNDRNREWRKLKCQILGERRPEFARMSLRPGVGAAALNVIMDTIESLPIGVKDKMLVPSRLRVGKGFSPIGRYLKNRLKGMTGLGDVSLEQYGLPARVEMLEYVKEHGWQGKNIKEINIDINKQKVLTIAARQKIYESRREL